MSKAVVPSILETSQSSTLATGGDKGNDSYYAGVGSIDSTSNVPDSETQDEADVREDMMLFTTDNYDIL